MEISEQADNNDAELCVSHMYLTVMSLVSALKIMCRSAFTQCVVRAAHMQHRGVGHGALQRCIAHMSINTNGAHMHARIHNRGGCVCYVYGALHCAWYAEQICLVCP